MERVYQRSRPHARTYASTNRRNVEEDKPLFSVKKLAAQAVASIMVFSLIYGVSFFDNPFCNAIKNEVAYTLNYTIDLHKAYLSSQEVVKYLSGSLEQGRIYINNAVSTEETVQTPVPLPQDAVQTPLPDLTQPENIPTAPSVAE